MQTSEDQMREAQLAAWIHEQCRYHKPTDEQIHKFARIRRAAEEMMLVVVNNTPAGVDRDLALQYVRQAQMFANHAVSLEEPHE